ncbi:MAG: hypothetical protein SFX73_27655 [Kofleriaceae bacterium]|nr:hypothetical protein [Kofleriaceae bacterium]
MMMPFTCRASTRRELALFADISDPVSRLSLAKPVSELLLNGPLETDAALSALVAYLFDPRAGAILALDEQRHAWLDEPLFTWVGPGNAAPLDDHFAALAAARALAQGNTLADVARNGRFAPRADDAIALAVSALDPSVQAATLESLFADPGPDHTVLALSTVQCGRVLGWTPGLLDCAVAESIVDALLARMSAASPHPHLDQVMRALGPIARSQSSLGKRVLAAAYAGIAAVAPPKRSFLDQVTSISSTRGDIERFKLLPQRELARAWAFVLGYAAPTERTEFISVRDKLLAPPENGDLFGPFVEGLIAVGHVPAVAELAAGILASEAHGVGSALELAAALPLDPLASELTALIDATDPRTRVQAIAAVEMLDDDDNNDDDAIRIDERLAARLWDPSPEVCAAATRTLVARGRTDILADHAANEPDRTRRAIVLVGLGDLSVPSVAELAAGTLAGLDELDTIQPADDAETEVTPVMRLIAETLLATQQGLELTTDLVGGVQDAAGLFALAALPGAERDIGVLAPPEPRMRLAQVTLDVAMNNTDTELGTLALFLLCRMSAGDETIADVVSDALAASNGFGAQMIAALGELRVANEKTGSVLAPFLGADSPIGARITAAAIAGRTLPAEHPAWTQVRELLELGTFARAAAWAALRDRARRQLTP